MKLSQIEGLIAAPFTRFNDAGELDLNGVGRYAETLARNGVAGAFVGGSNGEGQSMDVAERMALAEAWIKESPKGFKTIVHAGTNSLPDAKKLMAHAKAAGACAAGIIAPSYHKPGSVKALAAYLADVAKAAPELPLYFYHMPGMTGVNFPVIDVLEAVDGLIPNFAGVKYTYENMMDFSQCLEFKERKYDMLFGRDEMLLPALLVGARGAVGSTYNFAAPLYVKVLERFKAGDFEGANLFQRKSYDMIRALFSQSVAPIPAQKAAMRLIGLDCGDARLPFSKLSKEDERKIAKALEGVGFDEYRCR